MTRFTLLFSYLAFLYVLPVYAQESITIQFKKSPLDAEIHDRVYPYSGVFGHVKENSNPDAIERAIYPEIDSSLSPYRGVLRNAPPPEERPALAFKSSPQSPCWDRMILDTDGDLDLNDEQPITWEGSTYNFVLTLRTDKSTPHSKIVYQREYVTSVRSLNKPPYKNYAVYLDTRVSDWLLSEPLNVSGKIYHLAAMPPVNLPLNLVYADKVFILSNSPKSPQVVGECPIGGMGQIGNQWYQISRTSDPLTLAFNLLNKSKTSVSEHPSANSDETPVGFSTFKVQGPQITSLSAQAMQTLLLKITLWRNGNCCLESQSPLNQQALEIPSGHYDQLAAQIFTQQGECLIALETSPERSVEIIPGNQWKVVIPHMALRKFKIQSQKQSGSDHFWLHGIRLQQEFAQIQGGTIPSIPITQLGKCRIFSVRPHGHPEYRIPGPADCKIYYKDNPQRTIAIRQNHDACYRDDYYLIYPDRAINLSIGTEVIIDFALSVGDTYKQYFGDIWTRASYRIP